MRVSVCARECCQSDSENKVARAKKIRRVLNFEEEEKSVLNTKV